MKLPVAFTYDFEYKGFVVSVPALPGCVSQGKTRAEALKNIREAARGYIKVLKEKHQTIPLRAVKQDFISVTV